MAEKREGLFGLFKKKENKEEELVQAEAADESKAAEADPETEKRTEVDFAQLDIRPEGALSKLYRTWQPEGLFPVTTLAGCPMLPEGEELSKECKRLTALMEQDARQRLEVILAIERTKEEQHRAKQAEKLRELIAAGKNAEEAAREIVEEEAMAGEEEDEGPSLDASCRVYCSDNGLVAWMLIFPPRGSAGTLRFEMLGEAMQAVNIDKGVDSTAVASLFQKKEYFKLTPIAFGTPPVEGEDGKLIDRFQRELSKEVKLDEHGVADYRAQNLIQVVCQGEVICDIEPPKEGTPGVRVDGTPAKPRPVKPATVPSGGNTKISDNGRQLVATLDGHLEYSGGVFQVKPVLEISGDVDYSTGNIDFRGDVHIHGDVRENFYIRATGTVTVDGLVEAANIEAGGDVLVTCGVLGDNRALLKGGGDVRAKYLENCVAYAGKCVYADCIIASQVFSDDGIDATSGRGTVIGGALVAAHSIKARIIGSESGRETELTLGTLPYVQNELNDIEVDLQAVRTELEELDKSLQFLSENDGMQGSSEKLAKARLRKSVVSMKEQKLVKRREKLELMVPDLSKCRLECSTIHPITTLNVQGLIWRAEATRHSCKLSYDPKTGEIKEH